MRRGFVRFYFHFFLPHLTVNYDNCAECHRSANEDEVKSYGQSGKRDSQKERSTLKNYNEERKHKEHDKKKGEYKKHRDDDHHEDNEEKSH